jgi:hypothetical protein
MNKLSQAEISRGLRALDSVKHCKDKMGDDEYIHDSNMRNTAPVKWKWDDIVTQEQTALRINGCNSIQ